eukprot:TRINITY_DN4288_c0_g2_i1.p1 TRINITY_DN4288_c0_g2~~TRINITY_DN4288_c0_g2_i1.p1  ORF type:complete len:382 (-),score=91.54 TRINITY_DN4288_c0_g2_i1:96-1112(-)
MVKAGCRKSGLSEETDELRVEACGKRVKVLSKDRSNFTVSCQVPGVEGEVLFGMESLREADKPEFLSRPSVATWYLPLFVDKEWEAEREREATTSYVGNLCTRGMKRGLERHELATAVKSSIGGLSESVAAKEAKKAVTCVLEAAAIAGLRDALPQDREETLAEAYQINGATYALDEALRLAKQIPSKAGARVITAPAAAASAIVAKRREGAVYDGSKRHFMTNSGATKKQVTNFAQSLTASIFKASKQKGTKKRGADSLSPPPKNMGRQMAATSTAGRGQRGQLAATQAGFTQGSSSPPSSPTSNALKLHAMQMSQSTSFMGKSKISAISTEEGDGF